MQNPDLNSGVALESSSQTEPFRLENCLTLKPFALCLALLVAAMFPQVLLGSQSFFFRDFGIFGYPLAHYHRECFWRGELPLWNPLSNCGLPYLAQWNMLTLYPLSLIYLLLPLPWSLNLFALVHLFLAGLGMYWLAWSWTGNRLAAAVAGLGFAFNGLTFSCLMWPNIIAALGCMPWVIWAADNGLQKGGRYLVIAALAGAVQMLAGAPEIILFTWVIIFGLWLGKLAPAWRRPKATDVPARSPSLRQVFLRLLLLVSLIAGLAAAQLLPFFDLLAHSQRTQAFGQATWSMPAWGWLNLILPLFRCYESPAGIYFQMQQEWTSSYYPGIGVLFLALLALGQRRSWRIGVLWTVAGLGLVLALGETGKVYAWLMHLFPGLGFMRYPIKFVVLMNFALPLLAAFGVAHWQAAQNRPSKLRQPLLTLLVLLAVAAGGLWFSYRHPYLNLTWSTLCANSAIRIAFLLLAAGAVLLLARPGWNRWQAHLQCALLGLLTLDAWTHVPWQNPTVTSSAYQSGMLTRDLADNGHQVRGRLFMTLNTHQAIFKAMLPDPFQDYCGRRFALLGNCNLLEDLPTPDGFYPLYLPAQREIWSRLFFSAPEKMPAGLADFLGLSLVTTNLFRWQARPSALPVATIGAKPSFLMPSQIPDKLFQTDFDPRTTVYLPMEAKSAVDAPFASSRLASESETAPPGASAKILATKSSAHRHDFSIEAKEPALLVLSQTWHHNWRAYLDGTPVRIWRANHAFQAVEVPAGRHEVKLAYKDPMFFCGCVMSGLVFVGCILGLAWARNRIKLEHPGG